jgi:hypothetical protein
MLPGAHVAFGGRQHLNRWEDNSVELVFADDADDQPRQLAFQHNDLIRSAVFEVKSLFVCLLFV